MRYPGNPPERRAVLTEKQKGGYRAPDTLEELLSTRDCIVGGAFTLASRGAPGIVSCCQAVR